MAVLRWNITIDRKVSTASSLSGDKIFLASHNTLLFLQKKGGGRGLILPTGLPNSNGMAICWLNLICRCLWQFTKLISLSNLITAMLCDTYQHFSLHGKYIQYLYFCFCFIHTRVPVFSKLSCGLVLWYCKYVLSGMIFSILSPFVIV